MPGMVNVRAAPAEKVPAVIVTVNTPAVMAAVPAPQSRLERLQSAARAGSEVRESKAQWIEKNAPRDRTGLFETPRYEDTGEQPRQPRE